MSRRSCADGNGGEGKGTGQPIPPLAAVAAKQVSTGANYFSCCPHSRSAGVEGRRGLPAGSGDPYPAAA